MAPLPSESNHDFFYAISKARKEANEAYSSSTSSLGVDGVFNQERQSKPFKQNNASQQSLMSYSEDGFQSDPNLLSGFLNSSLKITGLSSKLDKSQPTKTDKSNSVNAMEMSLNTIGEFGDISMNAMKMTESQANMSLANVFDESQVVEGN